eukprot:scaffold449_cov241-Pinguiococcus_pyrenoidosus.AAC.3
MSSIISLPANRGQVLLEDRRTKAPLPAAKKRAKTACLSVRRGTRAPLPSFVNARTTPALGRRSPTRCDEVRLGSHHRGRSGGAGFGFRAGPSRVAQSEALCGHRRDGALYGGGRGSGVSCATRRGTAWAMLKREVQARRIAGGVDGSVFKHRV